MRCVVSILPAGFILLFISVFTPGCASARRAMPAAGSTAVEPAPYTRVGHPNESTVALEIAVRKFSPVKGHGPVVWLTGVSHVGQSNYFAALQRHLDAQSLVLFEGVGARNRKMRFDPDEDASVQHTLATSLGLVFQLTAIDYDRARFKNSDLTVTELQRLMTQQPAVGGTGEGTNSAQGSRELDELMGVMNGSSMLGALVHLGIKFIGASPKLQAMAKLAMIETLGRFQGDLSQVKGIPPELQRLMKVLIRSRNDVVLRDLGQQLRTGQPGESIAVFYGAGHMIDLEKRLVSELGYRRRGERWYTAMSVNTHSAGLTQVELDTVRELVRWQLEAMKP